MTEAAGTLEPALRVRRRSALPRLSWALRVDDGGAEVLCGDGVAEGPGGIFEGSWARAGSPFEASPGALHYGSGVVSRAPGQWTLIAPTHTLEAVYVARTPTATVASNSLAFVMELAPEAAAPIGRLTGPLNTIAQGTADYQRLLHADGGSELYRFAHCLVSLGETLEEIQYVPDYEFDDFEGLRALLLDTVRSVRANAGDARLVTYLSRGYDSALCAGLIAGLGGGRAITVPESRQGLDDDGVPVAQALGLDPVVIAPKRREYESLERHWGEDRRVVLDDADVASIYEFCVGFGVSDEVLQVPDEHVAGAVVLTGFHGDLAWDLGYEGSPAVIRRKDTSGAGLYEFRLRAGFVHLPTPFVTAARQDLVRRVAHSEEMRPWRVGGGYDRPIPRRIAEEAGAVRGTFGVRKLAAATLSTNLVEVREAMFDRVRGRYRAALAPS